MREPAVRARRRPALAPGRRSSAASASSAARPSCSARSLLDLFAVLFGGAVALLPVFAQTILHTGPLGLGVLRSAPAVGAVLAGVDPRPPPAGRTPGPTLIVVVGRSAPA